MSIVTTVTPGSPGHSPRNGLRLLRALPSDRALLPLSFADSTRDLGASVGASGPHDFIVHRSALSSSAQPASIASRPAFRDDREPPLSVRRDSFALFLFLPCR